MVFEYCLNKASESELVQHLSHCDADFVPTLSSRMEINDYAKKLANYAVRFEAWSDDALVGLVAAYCNDATRRTAYISSVSVVSARHGYGVASELLRQCVAHAKCLEMEQIDLEVGRSNSKAINLYAKSGFVPKMGDAPFVVMEMKLTGLNA
jgi:ribosomal protein S18 acetylase RimI-like enzyme